jgi:hypothetical protein
VDNLTYPRMCGVARPIIRQSPRNRTLAIVVATIFRYEAERAVAASSTVGFHKVETMTNVQNHLISHKLNDRLIDYT